jgi:hypothetical protein
MAGYLMQGGGLTAEREVMEEIEFVKSMQVLKIQENDILVLKIDRKLPAEMHGRLKDVIRENLPENLKGKIKIFVLEEGLDIGVIRAEAA